MYMDLKWIKKHYGETMMKFCRLNFSTILEQKGLLKILMEENFCSSKFLIRDILLQNKEEEFMQFLYNKANYAIEQLTYSTKSPYELMDEAGYVLYKCETEEQIQRFKKYYEKKEELCTFNDGRIMKYHVFFAVKKNIDKIKRSNTPSREDDYGTSVISIQFYKGIKNNVSIKNRYNHSIVNPDATFNNNLDNIIEGLTSSFINEFGYKITNIDNDTKFNLTDYILAKDNKYYKYNIEKHGVYYCSDNIVIEEEAIHRFDKEKCLLIDNYLINLKDKKIFSLSKDDLTLEEHFTQIEKIKIEKHNDEKHIFITDKNYCLTSKIVVNKNNTITYIYLPNIKKISKGFLRYNKVLKEIDLPEVEEIDDDFLFDNVGMKKINLPKLKKINNGFLSSNSSICEVYLPEVIQINDFFLANNRSLEEINLPKIIKIKKNFIMANRILHTITLPLVEEIGDEFLFTNTNLTNLDLPQIKEIGNAFIFDNRRIKNLNFPNIEHIGNNFLYSNKKIKKRYIVNH